MDQHKHSDTSRQTMTTATKWYSRIQAKRAERSATLPSRNITTDSSERSHQRVPHRSSVSGFTPSVVERAATYIATAPPPVAQLRQCRHQLQRRSAACRSGEGYHARHVILGDSDGVYSGDHQLEKQEEDREIK